MSGDPITDEIRSIRHELAAQCENNVGKIFADVRKREATDGRTYVTLPKRCAQEAMAEQSAGHRAADHAVSNG